MKKVKQIIALMTAAVLLAGCSGGTTQQASPAASTDAAGAASTETAAADTAASEAASEADATPANQASPSTNYPSPRTRHERHTRVTATGSSPSRQPPFWP